MEDISVQPEIKPKAVKCKRWGLILFFVFLTALAVFSIVRWRKLVNSGPVVFDVYSLSSLDANDIIDSFTKLYGKPDLFVEPLGQQNSGQKKSGTIGWREKEIMFSFNYFKNGQIENETFFVEALEEKYNIGAVLTALDLSTNIWHGNWQGGFVDLGFAQVNIQLVSSINTKR